MIHLETERLVLRPLRLEDAESMFAYASDPEMTSYTSWTPHKAIEESKMFIYGALERHAAAPLDALAITFKDRPGIVIGTLGIKTRSHEYEGELAYALAREHWRQGLSFEACSALIDKAFTEYGYKRIFATCAQENIASKSLMKKLGMVFEGCLRSRSYCKDRFWNVEYYAILKDEWLSTKASQK